ncbi:PREDICTED: MAGUK p55 subfamily member 6-like [Pterocles gutturalis]|uniref:MAGUK p55 subfamily member 6-like n=1 Tax=Pterocles gutturalis TaxID=240206 RepID=UPI000529202D|nr:PREDICTED: MAGUK p55 subfamily member 6-like [Pterocles gutturalis]
MQQVLDNLTDLPTSTGAEEIDLIFLKGIMENPIVRSLAKAHERLEDSKLEAVSDNNLELVNEILEDISPLINKDENIAELVGILKEPHFQVPLFYCKLVLEKERMSLEELVFTMQKYWNWGPTGAVTDLTKIPCVRETKADKLKRMNQKIEKDLSEVLE